MSETADTLPDADTLRDPLTALSGGTLPAPAINKPLRTDSFGDRVLSVAANLAILRVTTVIGQVGAGHVDDLHQVTSIKVDPENQHVASLSINMALGDTSLLMSQIFMDNEPYRTLHEKTVATALQVRADTVKLLADIYKDFSGKLGF